MKTVKSDKEKLRKSFIENKLNFVKVESMNVDGYEILLQFIENIYDELELNEENRFVCLRKIYFQKTWDMMFCLAN